MADLTPTKPGYYWAQWRKAVSGTRDAAELTPSDDWEPVQVFENALDDQHPEYLMVEVGGVERAQGLDCFVWGPMLLAMPTQPSNDVALECHGLDTPERVCFYEQDFYVLSNFSSFQIEWTSNWRFPTSEHVYHWLKFATGFDLLDAAGVDAAAVAKKIQVAPSAHEAFKIAERHKELRRPDWDAVKVDFMRKVIRAKARQHEYVRRKLLATGNRELVENSWRDDFWGWGPNRDGKNMLGKLWMEIRAELRAPEAHHG